MDAEVSHDAASPATGESDSEMRRAVHQAIKAVSEDLSDDFQFNTAISELMKLSNALSSGLAQASTGVRQEAMSALVRLLAPFAPHLAEEFWQRLGGQDSVHRQPWPDHDPDALVMDSIEVVIQVKGKVRGSMSVAVDCSKEELERLALASDVAQRWLEGKPPQTRDCGSRKARQPGAEHLTDQPLLKRSEAGLSQLPCATYPRSLPVR